MRLSAWDSTFLLHASHSVYTWIQRGRGRPRKAWIGRALDRPVGAMAIVLAIPLTLALGYLLVLWTPRLPRPPSQPPPLRWEDLLWMTGLIALMGWFILVGAARNGRKGRVIVAHERTAVINRALKRGLTDPNAAQALTSTVESRRSWWKDRLSSHSTAGVSRIGLVSPFARVATFTLILAFALPTITDASDSAFSLFPLAVVFSWPFVLLAFLRVGNRRVHQRMLAGQCPDCGYDATAVPPAFDEPSLATLGPARCTECGSPWPLVPPPAADEISRRLGAPPIPAAVHGHGSASG